MYAYYRTTCFSTHIQHILRGNISNRQETDIVFVKGGSLEWLTVHTLTDANPNVLQTQLEQSTFGIINDAKILHVEFDQDCRSPTDDETDYEETSYSKKTRDHSAVQGDDIIVALSEYGKLVFMTIIQNAMTKRFETLAEVYLDSPGLEYTKKGKKLAIDPSGRAIAVASFQDHFDILILDKSASRIHFDPIIGRGSEFEEGIIWHMEFLYTESDSMDRIPLVLVVYNDVERLCRLVLYLIDASDMQNVTIEKISRLPLEKNTPLPLLLIPLSFQPEAFLLVTEQNVSYLKADDLACGNVLYPTSTIPKKPKSLERPLFTAYALVSKEENIVYLGSSEGHLYRVEIQTQGEQGNIIWHALETTNPISQAMCVLGRLNVEEPNRGFREADLLLCAGESADSQVLAMCTSTLPFKRHVIQNIVNRAPLTDFQVAENFVGDQDAIVTCSGQDNHGALSIITHGIEALPIVQSSKSEWNGASRLWNVTVSMPDMDQVSCLVISSLMDTRLLSAKDGNIRDITSLSNVQINTETIYASSVTVNNHQLLLQVHSTGFLVVDVGSKDVLLNYKPSFGSNDRIEIATSWRMDDATFIALCIVVEDSFSLEVLKIVSDSSGLSSLSYKQIAIEVLSYCPSYVEQLGIRSKPTLVVGTFQPSILLYAIEQESIHKVQKIDLSLQEPGIFAVPYSAAILQSWLVVGLRQGSILCIQMTFERQDDYLNHQELRLIHVGQTAVKLIPCQDGIYALSDQLWKITCDDQQHDVHLDRVLVPKFGCINALCLFDCDLPMSYGERVALIADDKLHVFALSPANQMTTRKIDLKATPRKIIYDESLDCLIAITTCMENGDRKNLLSLIDPTSGRILTDSQLLWTNTDYGRSDMVLSATEWSVQNKNKTYKYLCIGLGHPKEPFHSFRSGMSARVSKALMDRGTLLLFRLKSNNKFPLKRVWYQEKLPGGVFAICPHSAGLLFSAGSHLYLYRLNPITGSLVEVAHKALQYLITSIHEEGGRICVTFHNDSVSFYEFDIESKTYEFLKSDAVSRSIHRSLMLSNRLAVGVSQSGGMVALHDDPNDRSFERRLQCVFNFHYADIIVKPKLATLQTQAKLTSYILPWTQNNTTATVKPIVGCTVSGGMIHVFHISEPLYQLLHTLSEELIEFDATRPLLGSTSNFKWFCKLSGAEQATVHGDLVELFLRLSKEEQLAVISAEDGQVKVPIQLALNEFGVDQNEDPVHLMKNILQSFENFK